MTLVANQARAVVWAQWRAYRNGMGNTWAWLSYGLAAVWYGAWLAAGLAAAFLMARPEASDLTVQISGALLLISLYWQVIPLMIAATGMSLDLQKLKIYPIPIRQLFTIEVLLRITAAAEMFLILGGAAVGLLFNPALSGFRALAVFPFAAFHMLLALGLRDAIIRLLGRRRIRNIAGILFVALFTVPRLMMGPRSGGGRWLAEQFTEKADQNPFPWLPWVATAHILTGDEAWTGLAVMLGWTALAGVFALWQFKRTLQFDPEAAQSAGSGAPAGPRAGLMDRLYRLPSALLPDPVGVLLEKEMRYLLRSARFRMMFLMACAFGLVISRAASRGGGGPSWGPSFLTPASAYAMLLLGQVCVWNSFGFDRSAAQMYFVAPVRFRLVLIAKNLAAVLCFVLAQTVVILLGIALRFQVTGVIIADAFAVMLVITLYLMAAGNYISVSNAYGLDPDSSMRSRSPGGFQMLLLVLYPLVFLPAALAYLARWALDSQFAFYGVLGVMAAIGASMYYVALDSITEQAESKKEAMLTALSAGQGPISS